jgi:transposase
LLPGRAGSVGVTARDNRLFVEAVLYRYRAGIAWRDLPERFGFRLLKRYGNQDLCNKSSPLIRLPFPVA